MEEIEKAASEAQKIIDKIEASNPEIHKMMGIVKIFLQKARVMCYGGTAINNLLPKEKQFYDPEKDIPDYDFFTETPHKHAIEIADALVSAGIQNVEVKPGVHLGTFKVFADYTGVADVTSMDREVFHKLWSESIEKDGIHYVPPNFLRMSVYLELSRPRGYVERWKKVYGRLRLLNSEYPIVCPPEDVKFHEENIDKDTVKKIEKMLTKENVILLGFNASTIQKEKHSWKLPLDLLVNPEHIEHVIGETMAIFKDSGVHRKDFHEYSEILPAHTDINKHNKLIVRIFETDACHSYHQLENGMKIASIPTLLNFFFAMLYADHEFIEHTSRQRVICTTQELVELADNSGKRRFKLLTPIECSGNQKDLMDMKKEKVELYSKLSRNRQSKEFLKYFFTYTPKPKHSFRGRGHINLTGMFPEKSGVDYSKLLMTPEGEYSITKRHDSKQIVKHMKDLAGSLKTKTVADLTGNVGGDTIMFGLNFLRVDSFELNHDNFKALKNNVETFKLNNVHLHEGDSTKLFHEKVDILYMDPPWGGPDYKDKEKLDLFLGDLKVSDYLKTVLDSEWRPRFVFMKVPANYNFDSLNDLPNVKKILKYKIRGFYLLGFKVL